jgi:hypothetical protein
MDGPMKRFLMLTLISLLFLGSAHADERSDAIDIFILIDSSLSMQEAMPAARDYVAGELIGRVALPGDYVMVLSFYGGQDILWQDELRSEGDKAELVRSLRGLEAVGRFTDIGAALDALDSLVIARGLPERAKYIVLVTDERQEAPYGTRYYSPNYNIEHRLLEYVKRDDRGLFRVITIGYGLSDKIADQTQALLRTLSEPPARPSPALPGASPQDMKGQGAENAADANGAARSASATGAGGIFGIRVFNDEGRINPAFLILLAAGLALALLVVFLVVWLRSRKKDDEKKKGAAAQ